MEKLDLKKQYKTLYAPSSRDFSLVDVPELSYLMVDGHGDPNTAPEYVQAIEALYSVAYPLKFMSKKILGRDYGVAPLEGLWWSKDMTAFMDGRKDDWDWTMMILQPDWITADMVANMRAEAQGKKDNPALAGLRLERLTEGPSLQILHIGPYAAEGPTLLRLHQDYMPEHGFTYNGKHHEIYLGDPRKTAPDKLRTILRQPVRRIDG